jgi:hypothetical protein
LAWSASSSPAVAATDHMVLLYLIATAINVVNWRLFPCEWSAPYK